jgi:hypothetical protein
MTHHTNKLSRNFLILTLLTFTLSGSSIAFASEVTGTLDSSGIAATSSSSGSLEGSVSSNNNTSGGSSGGGSRSNSSSGSSLSNSPTGAVLGASTSNLPGTTPLLPSAGYPEAGNNFFLTLFIAFGVAGLTTLLYKLYLQRAHKPI